MESFELQGCLRPWTQLPGLFSWSEVASLVERSLEVATREVRASLASDRGGPPLYRVFVADLAPCPD